jgi:hypothetical protein
MTVRTRSMLAAMAVGLGISGTAVAASESSRVEGLEWRWESGEHRRWLVEAEVNLPTFLWFYADRITNTRLVAYQLRMVVDCTAVDQRAKGVELGCVMEDVSLSGAASPTDQGLLQEVLDEVDGKLTGGTLQIVLRDDGQLVNFDLEEVVPLDINRRTMLMQENIRLVVARAMAGMDMKLPKRGVAEEGLWPQYDAMLMIAPSSAGAYASSEVVHRVVERAGDAVVLETAGRGILSTAEAENNKYDSELRSMAVFDTEAGALQERVWTVYAAPTAGSAISEGYAGIPYTQWGRIRMLDDDERPELPPSVELAVPGQGPSTLQQWRPMGVDSRLPSGGL